MAATRTKARRGQVSFQDQLSRLTYHQARELLGEEGAKLLRAGAKLREIDLEEDVYLGGDLLRVRVPDSELPERPAIVVITRMSARSGALHLRCDHCEVPCRHAGAALNLLLANKLLLGLSAPPDETVPLELLTEDELLQRALAERRERASAERMSLRSTNPETPWTDYIITSHVSGKSYRVALQGDQPGQAFCSCPDFRTNHLGTCKHILHTLEKVRKRFTKAALAKPYRHKQIAAWLDYGVPLGLKFNLPDKADPDVRKLAGRYASEPLTSAADAVTLLRKLERAGQNVLVYPDAEEWIERELMQARLQETAAEIRRDPKRHALRRELLKVELLPYQMAASASPWARVGPCLPMTWDWARPSRGSAWRNCWRGWPASGGCWSSLPPRSRASGATRSTASATAPRSSWSARRPTASRSTGTASSSRSATTSRYCATSMPSSACRGT
jgi:hypothetical protein